MRCRGCSTSAAATFRTRRWCSRSRWCERMPARRSYVDLRKLGNEEPRAARRHGRRAPERRVRARSRRARQGTSPAAARSLRVPGGDRADCPGARRRSAARPRSDCGNEGDQEPRRDCRCPGGATARRRRGDALSRLVRPSGAARRAYRNRRGRGDGDFRRETGLLKDVSFPTIAGAGPNGAIVHYRVTRKSNRRIQPDELFLLDSGGQYEDGTTDITRTVAVGTPGGDMREKFTLRAQGPYRACPGGVSRRHQRRTARYAGATVSLAGRPRFRPRHRPRRRQLSVGP